MDSRGHAPLQIVPSPTLSQRLSVRRILSLTGYLFPRNPTAEPVSTRMVLDATPDEVWNGILFYEEVPGRPPWYLKLFLPAPVRTDGVKQQVGAIIRCTYEAAHLIKQITVAEPGKLMRFDVLEQRLGVEPCVTMGEGSYKITALPEGGSEVILTTFYKGHMRPRFLFRALEHHLAHKLHRFILDGMKLHLAETRRNASQSRTIDAAE